MNQQIQDFKNKKSNLESLFGKMKNQFSEALPKHISYERFVRIALNSVTTTPKLLECDQKSFLLSVMRSAQLGLEPDGLLGQAYLLPYGKQVQLIIGYKGLMTLARQSGEISMLMASDVCENDNYSFDFFGDAKFEKRIIGDRGNVIGYIAIARFKDGTFQYEFMTIPEIEAIRNKSQGYKSAISCQKSHPWIEYFGEMAKKTVIRRLSKYLPLSVQKATHVETLQEQGVSFDMKDGDIVLHDDGVIIDNDDVEFAAKTNTTPDATEAELVKKSSKLDEIIPQ